MSYFLQEYWKEYNYKKATQSFWLRWCQVKILEVNVGSCCPSGFLRSLYLRLCPENDCINFLLCRSIIKRLISEMIHITGLGLLLFIMFATDLVSIQLTSKFYMYDNDVILFNSLIRSIGRWIAISEWLPNKPPQLHINSSKSSLFLA